MAKTLVIISGTYSNLGKCALFFDNRPEALKYIDKFEDIDGFDLRDGDSNHRKLVFKADSRQYIDIELRDTEKPIKYAITYSGKLPDNIKKPLITNDFERFNAFDDAYEYAIDFLVKNGVDPKPGENKKSSWILRDERNYKSYLKIVVRETPDKEAEKTYSARDLVQLITKYCREYSDAYEKAKKDAFINMFIGILGIIAAISIILYALLSKNYGALNLFLYLFYVWILPIVCLSKGYEAITNGYVLEEIQEK